MKKIFLVLVVAIVSMAISAQPVRNTQLPKPDLSKARHAITAPRTEFSPSLRDATPQLNEAVVTPPEDLETRSYRLNGYIFDGSNWEAVDRT